jgi:hypothetical protein
MRAKRIGPSIATAALAFTPALAFAGSQTTDVLCAYFIDADSEELTRYAFVDDTFTTVGVVKTASGTQLQDMESLAWVPAGPGKGMYAVPTKNPFENQVVRIDPITAVATPFATKIIPSDSTDGPNDRKITGMASYRDPVLNKWFVLAASSEDRTSSQTASESRELVRIDPEAGTATILATQAQLGNGLRLEGLGIDANGDVWAVSRTHLFRIHQEAGYWVEDMGATTGGDKTEAFEIAFGDSDPGLNIPGVPASWVQDGVFFIADEQMGSSGKFGVMNPATAQFVELQVNGSPSSIIGRDPEGMVILTLSQDPLYGMYITSD